jgi:heme exporter protein CcmD
VIDFLSMDGYARFVWPSYGITLAIVIGLGWAARRRRLAALADARRTVPEQPGSRPTVRRIE